jgi:hypothetical protein
MKSLKLFAALCSTAVLCSCAGFVATTPVRTYDSTVSSTYVAPSASYSAANAEAGSGAGGGSGGGVRR